MNNFCTPDAFEADALIACEVLTPGGNWSSYPPHKHDEASATESELEEIYYFEAAPTARLRLLASMLYGSVVYGHPWQPRRSTSWPRCAVATSY